MNETQFRVLDTLSREIGHQKSISELTREIGERYGTAYYSNIYDALQELKREGVINLTKAGNTSLVSLELGRIPAIDLLAQMELKKKHEFLKKREEFQLLLEQLSSLSAPGSICLVDPERNAKLNRAELLITLPKRGGLGDARKALYNRLREISSKSNMRIDALALDEDEFQQLLASREKNPLKEMLANKVVLFAPDMFWTGLRNAWVHGIRIELEPGETNPAKISEQDLVYNLARFGYTELGPRVKEDQDIAIEYLAVSLLLKGGERRIETIPVILAKNEVNYDLLIFLSRKYGVAERLLGLLKALERAKPDDGLRRAIQALEIMQVSEKKADEASIVQKLKLYNAA